NILLGSNLKSDLKWNDFDYLKKERDISLNILTSAVNNKTKGINILLFGSVGTGKTQFSKLVANKAKIDIYSVSAEIMDKEATRTDRLNDLVSKQTILSKMDNSCILFDEAEDVMNRGFSEFGSASKAYLNTLIEETPVPIIWTTNNIYNVDPAFLRRMTYTIEFEKLSEDVRLNIWKRTLRKNKLKVDNKRLMQLNKNYEISPSLITNAVNTTKLINGSQDDFEMFVENLARVVTKKKNVKKKKEFEMKEYNDDLVNTDLDIKDLTSKIKSCGKLNFSLCLYGEPGTGKSLYARYLANELGLDVILKRASDLMSKYVGETEQNIAEAFAEAKSKKAMLIFDEADSFLQNRNNAVRNWEVSQVNEMLTWMESHEYPFVCTTNLLDTLDEASLRRFTFKIKFDFMTKQQVNNAFEHFFGIKNANVDIKGLTAGDFATVKKKADFLCVNELSKLCKMLEDEVKIKKSKSLQNVIGF
uniref:AAA family ATPase n=1 Tax=Candidatus Stercorousia sp. TaxID=3048886 RepID=UPI00402A0CCD